MKKLLLALGAVLVSGAALAQATTPVGVWKTIDDKTKVEKSLVRISEAGGVLSGRIEKLLDPAAKPDAVCEECTDERKGKPILGMTILNGVKKNAEHEGLWDGGTILDPNNGKTYKVRLKPSQDGKTLEVRGYIGVPMLGRSQTWLRVE
ncbi:MAG: DUF2147 domain-containing protein [Rhizobacter sp.]|nr:DUF2147 domain-containing protein [Rhizobacter sp.]